MILVTGSTPSKRKLVREVLHWFMDRFEIPSYSVHISVVLIPKSSDVVTADILPGDDLIDYRIRVHCPINLSRYRLIDRTMHEMVHLRQYWSGELVQTGSSDYVFCKVKYSSVAEDDLYVPWEVMARGEEHFLTYDFCRSKGVKFLRSTIGRKLIADIFC